jgi:hypothetical protein
MDKSLQIEGDGLLGQDLLLDSEDGVRGFS